MDELLMLVRGGSRCYYCTRSSVSVAIDGKISLQVPVCIWHIRTRQVLAHRWEAYDEWNGTLEPRRARFKWLAQYLIYLDQRAAALGRVSRGQRRRARG